MPGQYFAYIPFNTNTQELQSGVERWVLNIDDVNAKYDFVDGVADKLQLLVDKGGLEKSDLKDKKEKIQLLRDRASHRIPANQKPTLLMHDGAKTQPLAGLDKLKPEAYTLYVVGHCAPGSTTLRETQSIQTSKDPLTASGLIGRMGKDGLPKTILNLKLLACYGGKADDDHNSKAFSDAVWKELRGYCTNLVKLTAYTEPVLLSEFYKGDASNLEVAAPSKVFGQLELGKPVPAKVPVGGRLSDKKKVYEARPCLICKKPILIRCSVCKSEFCGQECNEKHLKEDNKSCNIGMKL